MQSEDSIHIGILQHPFLYHKQGSPFLPGGWSFFGGLKDQDGGAVEIAGLGEVFRGAEQHRRREVRFVEHRHRAAGDRGQRTQCRIDPPPRGGRIVQRGQQGDSAPQNHKDPLGHAKRAGWQAQDLFQVEARKHHGDECCDGQAEEAQDHRQVRGPLEAGEAQELLLLGGDGLELGGVLLAQLPGARQPGEGVQAEERERAREEKSEGLMLKKLDSPYLVGRKKGNWWKWKVDPLTVDAVLTYAMRGHGRRSNLFTDYTFGLWDDDKKELVTFAKAYSGLTDAEFRKLDNWIKKNTLERFGPVRSVTPHHVFEIAFEGIAESKRHKSGVATRFPRMVRWRTDKNIHEANTLGELRDLIPD